MSIARITRDLIAAGDRTYSLIIESEIRVESLDWLPQMPNLEILVIKSNFLTGSLDRLLLFPKLRILKLHNNMIAKSSDCDAILKLKKLEILNLSGNPFNKSDEDTRRFKLPGLVMLDGVRVAVNREDTSDEDEDYKLRRDNRLYHLGKTK